MIKQNYNLRRLESSIGLRASPFVPPLDSKRVDPLTPHCVRTTWFIPPPLGQGNDTITPHPHVCQHGVARLATLEKVKFAPNDPDALITRSLRQSNVV